MKNLVTKPKSARKVLTKVEPAAFSLVERLAKKHGTSKFVVVKSRSPSPKAIRAAQTLERFLNWQLEQAMPEIVRDVVVYGVDMRRVKWRHGPQVRKS